MAGRRRQTVLTHAQKQQEQKLRDMRYTSIVQRDEEVARLMEEHDSAEGGIMGLEWKVGADELARELERLRREVEGTETKLHERRI